MVDAVDTDSEFDGPAGAGSHSIPHGFVGVQHTNMFTASGNVQMRFANSLDGIDTALWEPLASTKDWTLDCAYGDICTVYGQFKDGADNESLITDQKIMLQSKIYIPVVLK
jgi:hypothetical protein